MKRMLGRFWTRGYWGIGLLALVACSPGGVQTNAGGGVGTFSKSYGGPADEFVADGIPTSDGGYLMTGIHGTSTITPGQGRLRNLRPDRGDLWVQKLDGVGDVVWSRIYGSQVPLDQYGLSFREARRGEDGSTWVAYQDFQSYQQTGDPLQDGGNVVISRYDPAGSLQWTQTFDAGVIPGYVFAGPTQTSQENVVDIWPMEDGDLRVAATVAAKVVQGNQVLNLEALWLLEVSASGNLVWDTLFLDPGGAHTYLGDNTEIQRVFLREMAGDQMLVVTSGVKEPNGFLGQQDPITEILSIGVGGVVANRTTRDMFVNDVGVWDLTLPAPTRGGVLVGYTGAATNPQASVLRVDDLGTEVLHWSTGAGTIHRVAVRPMNGAGGQDVEYWLGTWNFLERWTQGGLIIGSTLASQSGIALAHEPVSDRVWWFGKDGAHLYNGNLAPEVSVSLPDTFRAWSGPGLPVVHDGTLLSVIDVDGTIQANFSPGHSANTAEGGLRCIELSSGDFLISGVMLYNPSLPAERVEHAWYLQLDEFGNVVWETSLDREGLVDGQAFAGNLPVVEAPTGVLVGAGGDRALVLDSAGNPALATEHLGLRLNHLIPRTAGGFAALTTEEAGGTDFGVATLDGNLAVLSHGAVGIGSQDALFRPVSLVETPVGFATATARYGQINVTELDGAATPLQGWTYGLGPWRIIGNVSMERALDGSYILAGSLIHSVDSAGEGSTNGFLLKVNSSFQPVWYRIYGGLAQDYFHTVQALKTGYLAVGNSHSLGEGSEAWLVRTDPQGNISPGCNALLEAGTWPAGWTVSPLSPTVVSSATGPASPLPVDVGLVHAPTPPGTLDVARQCFGATLGEVPGSGPLMYTLTIEPMGGGEGNVISFPAGIDCGAACSFSFAPGTTVILTPVPGQGFFFSHWAGVDQDLGIEGASVVMNGNRTVQVWFE